MKQRQYVGFDVGGWLVRSSHDAVARLMISGHERKWDILSRDDKGHRRKNILHPDNSSKLIRELCVTCDAVQTIIAIDAALGWPTEFRDLINGEVPNPLPSIESKSIENKVLYRETERFIFHRTNTHPLTAVGDMFGNPSTKAQATALRIRGEFGAYMPPFDPWSRDSFCESQLTVVEVYPASIGEHGTFRDRVDAELAQVEAELKVKRQRALTGDEADAVCCALIAEDLQNAVCIGGWNALKYPL
ncbi:MAG: hypothetical protein IPH85_12235 [Ignavibacteria bacterium]|nr:hypothetical protein [Ignavibacteria bacterium]MBK7186664.1 hypothetical protein [Ignavibacteria bacterium]MBL0323413.1 hypothetical protein [Ignavibacteria bacterium]